MSTPATSPTTATWNIDPTHSSAEFKVKHMMISHVKGHFAKVTGPLTRSESTLGIQGKAPRTMSSILGWVAAVMAMVSPSQLRPAVSHRTSISEMGQDRRAGPMTRMSSLPCETQRRLEIGRVHFGPQTRIRQAGPVSREASVPNPPGPGPAVLEWAGSRGGLLVERASGLPPRSRFGSSKTTIHPVRSSA